MSLNRCVFTYILGFFLIAQWPGLSLLFCIKVIGVLLVLLIFVSMTQISSLGSSNIMPAITMILGVLFSCWHGLELQRGWLPESVYEKTIDLQGSIEGLPANLKELQRFNFSVTGEDGFNDSSSDNALVSRIRLSWYGGPELIPGEQWRLKVKIKPPLGSRSPGAFDLEAWAARENIQATGYVVSGVWLGTGNTSLINWRDRLRQVISSRVQVVLDSDTSGLLIALMVGDKSGISSQQWQWLNNTGTTHLMVISGLHIGLMATFGFWLAVLLGRMGLLPLRSIPLPFFAAVLALSMALGYAFLAGFSIPVQRALVMAGVALSGPLLGIRAKPSTLFLLALALVLTIDPLAMTSVGFWYSFSAVGALLYGLSGRLGMNGHWQRWGHPQWVVFLLLTPLLLFNGQSVSLLSPLINLVAIPLVAGLMVPMALLTLALGIFSDRLYQWMLWLLDGLMSYFIQTLAWLDQSAMQGITVNHSPGGFTEVLFAVIAVLLLLSSRALGVRLLVPVLLLPWCWPKETLPETGQAKVSILDVGQGLSVLVRTRSHVLLYDTGDAISPTFSMADRVVIPYLKREGVASLDRVIISHGDRDHAGGLNSLQTTIAYNSVWAGSGISDYSGYVSACELGQVWEWDQVRFEFLQAAGRWRASNDRSCVLKVTASGQSLLLTGDIGKRVEKALVSQLADYHSFETKNSEDKYVDVKKGRLQANYLLLPHHGSKHSGSEIFLESVQPDVTLISSGYLNRFGHPSKETLERVTKTQSKVFNTARDGSIEFVLGSGKGVSTYREEKQYYWHRSFM